MPNRARIRSFLSPLVAVTFSVVVVSGVLMLLHVRNGIVHGLHEWMGVALAVAGVAHLVLNWRALVAYLRHRWALAGVAVGAGLCVLIGFGAVTHDRDGGGHNPDGYAFRRGARGHR